MIAHDTPTKSPKGPSLHDFSLLAEYLPALCWMADEAGYIYWYNRRWYEYTGSAPAEMEGWGWQSVHDPSVLPDVLDRWTSAIATGEAFEMVFPLRSAAGDYRPFLTRARPCRDDSGRITHWFGTNVDISVQLAAEEAARQSDLCARAEAERVQLALAAGAILGTWLWDIPKDRFTVDEGFAAHFGLDPGVGREGLSLEQVIANVHPDDKPSLLVAIQEATARGGKYAHKYRVRRQDGNYYWIEANGRVNKGPDGKPLSFPGVLIDVEDRRLLEAERDRATRLLESVLETVPGVIYVKDRAGRLLLANDGTAQLIGKPRADILGKTDLEFLQNKAEAAAVMANDQRIMQSGTGEVLEEKVSLSDGGPATWLSCKQPFRDSQGEIMGLIGASIDITDQIRAREVLAKSREQLISEVERRTAELNRLWRTSQDLLLVAKTDTTIVSVNPAWTKLMGWQEEELVGRRCLDFIHPDDLAFTEAAAMQLSADGRTLRGVENRYRTKHGGWVDISWVVTTENEELHAVGRDVTREKASAAELERAQAQLRQSQKMEAIGQLTGGIAHDFNNMLAIVIGSLGMARRRLRIEPDRALELLGHAEEGANRAAVLTARLLAFSRQQPLEPKAIEPNKLVTSISELLCRTLGEHICLETVVSAGLWRTFVDPAQLESALVNVCVNSRDAMPNGGKLTIETVNSYIDEAYAARNGGLAPGQYVMISVTDTGDGIPAELLERVFEPFFTTKDAGKGTGLGLSQVFGFVKQSGGHLKIYSELGHGTTIKIYLPRYVGSEESVAWDRASSPLPRGSAEEIILVVEDEQDVRYVAVNLLRELGYTVIPASGAKLALDELDRNDDISLVLTDVVMPEMNGRQLAEKARSRWPSIPILFMTGYTRNAIVHNGTLDPGVSLIVKPFTQEQLARKVRAMLDLAVSS